MVWDDLTKRTPAKKEPKANKEPKVKTAPAPKTRFYVVSPNGWVDDFATIEDAEADIQEEIEQGQYASDFTVIEGIRTLGIDIEEQTISTIILT
jgi:hypothetical protein